jgi:hypothetical protein
MSRTIDQADRAVSELVMELRNTVTPVMGYLDLLLEAESSPLPEARLQWTRRIEHRLEDLRRVTEELIETCARLRESQPASNPPAAGAPGASASAPGASVEPRCTPSRPRLL